MSLNRCFKAGWEEISRPDERRGLWLKRSSAAIELCAGREGDDAHVAIHVGQVIDAETIAALIDVVDTYAYAVEMGATFCTDNLPAEVERDAERAARARAEEQRDRAKARVLEMGHDHDCPDYDVGDNCDEPSQCCCGYHTALADKPSEVT